jgi:hypothetical protein
MFQAAIESLADILARHGWMGELAGILPLSALIDFVEIPPKLHILELAGAIPLWSWTITPAGSRLLLAQEEKFVRQDCYQDRFGNTVALEALDGRYGGRYFASSPETLRLVLRDHPITEVENDHENMAGQGFELRMQNLEVAYVSRRDPKADSAPSRFLWRQVFFQSSRLFSPLYLTTTIFGWMLLISTVIMSAFFRTWISFAFLLLAPMTGAVISCLYGSRPRRLLVTSASETVRLLVVAEQMNSANWLVVYGESTLVNSLLNRPLEPNGPSLSPTMAKVCRFLLRILILGQWGLAIAAAATKNWNSYFICFWISFSIFSHAYLITPQRSAKDWSKFQANLTIKRYATKISTRRALMNTIVALNPNSFSFDSQAGVQDMTKFYKEGMRWLDPILIPSRNRSIWEEATLKAMAEAQQQLGAGDASLTQFRRHPGHCLSRIWNTDYASFYWGRFIPEGIYMARKIKNAAKLPERRVADAPA